MALDAGMRVGPYEILGLVAAGGMGEVYRARDSRLERIVAIKVVGSAMGNDPDMRQRFDSEARLAAQLHHPRIAAIHDVGHDGGVDYLVMEFIEGQSLAERIAAGALPFSELVGYAIELAAGLGYAHRRGVVHRDLKPSNILITPNGLKIIDFGLATLRQEEHRPSDEIAAMKTTPRRKTEADCIPGTAGYVPPERLQGFSADHRTDIFAFGAVLYEMASGRRAFDGATPADLIAAVLTAEPPPLTGGDPAIDELDWVVRRCLRKPPDERWQSIVDVEAVLKRIASASARRPANDAAIAQPPSRRTIISVASAAAAIAAAIGALGVLALQRPIAVDRPQPVALSIAPPPNGAFTPTESSVQSPQLAISPDGRAVAFVASGANGVPQIWVRALDSTDVLPVPGTEHAAYPFWSASSRSIGFFTDRQLKRVDLDGTPPRALASAPDGRGGSANADDVILFSRATTDAIYRLNADGSVVQQTKLSASQGDTSHRWPQFLPDGRHFLYFSRSGNGVPSSIRIASIDGGEDRVVVESGVGAVYGSGQLFYVSDGALLAAPFDAGRGRLTGGAVPVVSDVAISSNFYGAFSASVNGALAYAMKASTSELVWMARDGRRLGVAAPRGGYVDFRLSPDGRHLAIAEIEQHSGLSDLRLLDLQRGTNSRLTTSPATDASPVFSPDGTRLVFRSNRERGVHDLYLRPFSGGHDELFVSGPVAKSPTDWSRDGSIVVYHADDENTHHDIWAAALADPAHPRALVQTEYDEMQGQLSPSGRWLAYASNQSSRLEVYVQRTDNDSRKWPISTDGGSDPKWNPDEKQLYYIAGDGRLMSVDITSATMLEPGTPRPLFPLRDVGRLAPYPSAYEVHPDGRFLVREPIQDPHTLPLNVVVNWSPRAALSGRR